MYHNSLTMEQSRWEDLKLNQLLLKNTHYRLQACSGSCYTCTVHAYHHVALIWSSLLYALSSPDSEITRSDITRNIIMYKWATHCLRFLHKLAGEEKRTKLSRKTILKSFLLTAAWEELIDERHCRIDQVEQEVQGEGDTHTLTHTCRVLWSHQGVWAEKNCHPPSEGAEINEHITLCFCPLISLLRRSR